MNKLFALVENGSEADDKGATVVSGPDDSNLKNLHIEFRALDLTDSSNYPVPVHEHEVETSDTIRFASWLVEHKGFSRPAMGVFYVDDWKEEEFLKEYEGIRNDPNTPRTMDEVSKKIEGIKKGMIIPIVKPADNVQLRCKGWVVYDDADQENAVMVHLPLEWARKK